MVLLQTITLAVVVAVDQTYLLLLVEVQVVQESSSFLFLRHNLQSQRIFTQDQDNGPHRQELLRLIMFLLLAVAVGVLLLHHVQLERVAAQVDTYQVQDIQLRQVKHILLLLVLAQLR
jgi:hypothetical protein